MSGRLDETVPAFREALQENIRERVPLDWAMTTGNQGAALKLLAKRQGERRWRAVQQIFTTLRDGSDAPSAAHALAQSSPSAERSTRRIASIYLSAAMFTQQLDNVMRAPNVHVLWTPNRDGKAAPGLGRPDRISCAQGVQLLRGTGGAQFAQEVRQTNMR